jgi:hypothetical protein
MISSSIADALLKKIILNPTADVTIARLCHEGTGDTPHTWPADRACQLWTQWRPSESKASILQIDANLSSPSFPREECLDKVLHILRIPIHA